MAITIAAWSGTNARKCPKCETHIYGLPRWCAKMSCHIGEAEPKTFGNFAPEHMHRECENCHFVWLEHPADTQVATSKGGDRDGAGSR